MWGGRFGSGPDPIMEDINASIDFDRQLYRQDIAASKAHAAMLAKKGIIAAQDAKRIAHGLDTILSEIEVRQVRLQARARGHSHECRGPARRIDRAGGGYGCTPRARATIRWRPISGSGCATPSMKSTPRLPPFSARLARKALDHAATVMPGLTHLQPAQPVTFGHHLLAYVEMAARDRGRFADARARLNECPLGSGALAGTSFPIDRAMTAKALGFARPTANSLDAVADRDFVLETLSACAITAVHLSRLAEEIVIWSSPLTGLIRLSDKFTTGSSMMPQKRNPDAAELVRAKTGRIVGALIGLFDRDQGAAARLSKGSAGRQRGRDRRDRRARALADRDDRNGARHRARCRADGGGGGGGLFDRDRSGGLAGAHAQAAVPRGASPHRTDRRQGG